MKTGYLPHERVKAIVFWIITFCIILSTAAGILLAWGSIAEAIASKLFYSTAILAFGSLGFLLTNYLFGNLERDLFPPAPNNTEHMPTDPAFSERLAKAKAARNDHKPDANPDAKAG